MAYELNGSAESLGNGRYTVTLHDDAGKVFIGTATDQGNSVLSVIVHSQDGASFTGSAMDSESDEYNLKLKDTATGNPASGILEIHFH